MFELIKIGNQSVNDLAECRLEAETIFDEYYSVQFFLNAKGPSYSFQILESFKHTYKFIKL